MPLKVALLVHLLTGHTFRGLLRLESSDRSKSKEWCQVGVRGESALSCMATSSLEAIIVSSSSEMLIALLGSGKAFSFKGRDTAFNDKEDSSVFRGSMIQVRLLFI